MAPQIPESGDGPRNDPWRAGSYLVSGVLTYGLLGWLLDRWLETRFLIVIGILLGAALGFYMTWQQFGGRTPEQDEQS